MPESKRTIRSKKHREKRKKIRIWKRVLWGFGGLLVVGLLIWLINADTFEVREIEVRGSEVTNSKEIHEKAEQELSGFYYWVFPRDNVLLVPESSISDRIMVEFPRVRNVRVERSGLYELVVEVQEREPFGMWCGATRSSISKPSLQLEADTEDGDESSNCYFLDKTGYVFSEAPDFSGYVYFTYYGTLLKSDSLRLYRGKQPIGKRFLPPEKFAALNDFVGVVRRLDLYPVMYEKQENGTSLLILEDQGRDVVSGTLRFNTRDDLSLVAANLSEIVETGALFRQQGVEPDSVETLVASESATGSKDFEYIDLRYGNKVYFKFK